MRSDREERIRQRAYMIWQSEGHQHGRDEDHWHRAEREIAAEEAGAGKAPRRSAGSGKPPTEKSAIAKPSPSRRADANMPGQKQAPPKAHSTRTHNPTAED
jgi:hypothetical protein